MANNIILMLFLYMFCVGSAHNNNHIAFRYPRNCRTEIPVHFYAVGTLLRYFYLVMLLMQLGALSSNPVEEALNKFLQ